MQLAYKAITNSQTVDLKLIKEVREFSMNINMKKIRFIAFKNSMDCNEISKISLLPTFMNNQAHIKH